MEAAGKCWMTLNPRFEINALSAHRTPEEVSFFANMHNRGESRSLLQRAGMAAHLPGRDSLLTSLPVIGVRSKAS